MSEPLQAADYSLADEARLLRRLIAEATGAPALQEKLTLALAKVLAQDEARSIRESELLSREAVGQYADLLSHTIGTILRDELPEAQFWRVMDKIQEAVTGTPLPENDQAAQRRLLGRER
jgi:hypothetical protein